uniref:Uncharacterized protein n=1 Tax=Salix viminalis TaxID=40686 RepID=A0A6N2LTU2_SALVM
MRNITFFVLLTNRPARSLWLPRLASPRDRYRTSRIIMGSYIQEKIHKFEQFVDGHLKPQLVRTRFLSNKRFSQICE